MELAELLINSSLREIPCDTEVNRWLAKAATRVVEGAVRAEDQAQITALIGATAYDETAWPSVVSRYLQDSVGVGQSSRLPTEIWLLTGSFVFQKPENHLLLVERISSWLRKQIYGWQLGCPPLVTSENTLWLLLALNLLSNRITDKPSGIFQTLFDRATRPLSLVAWAGIWDQWVLIKYMKVATLNETTTTTMLSALHELPMWMVATAENSDKKSPMAKPNFKLPKWFEQIMPRVS